MPQNPVKILAKIPWLAIAGVTLACAAAFGQPSVSVNPATALGKPANLTLSIRCLAQDIKVGDPIPIEFTITNEGTDDYLYLDRNYDRLFGRMWEYSLGAQNALGKEMPNPETVRGDGGGLGTHGKLAPGASFQKTIDLNLWAMIRAPGVYQVTGTYDMSKANFNNTQGSVASKPISITVHPRTPAEMDAYVDGLLSELTVALNNEEWPNEVVVKLMYTGSPRIVPGLLDLMYQTNESAGWVSQAILYYVPTSPAVLELLLDTAAKRGLTSSMDYILRNYGTGDMAKSAITPKEMQPAIARSLAEDNPGGWEPGALAAQHYGNDAYTPRLIAIAEQPRAAQGIPEHSGRIQAIYALALNRNDDSVMELKKLLASPDSATRSEVAMAIRMSYLYRGDSLGRPLLKDDFDESYQKDPNANNLAKTGTSN